MEEQEYRIEPGMFLRCFLVVGGAFLANFILLFLVAYVVFPDSMAILTGDPEQFRKVLENEPDRVYPQEMFWVLLVGSVVTCSILGALVACLVPIGRFTNALLFAVALFLQYLQWAIGADWQLQRKLILFMAISPIAALIGSSFFLRGNAGEPKEYDSDEFVPELDKESSDL